MGYALGATTEHSRIVAKECLYDMQGQNKPGYFNKTTLNSVKIELIQ